MTSRYTSALGYFARGYAQELQGNRALGVGATRTLVNNLDHLQDEALQTCANITHPPASVAPDGLGYWTVPHTASSQWQRIPIPPLPVLLAVQPDGSSARAVVTVRVYVASGSTDIRCALRPLTTATTFDVPSLEWGARMAEQSTSATSVTALHFELYVPRIDDTYGVDGPGLDGSGSPTSVRAWFGQVDVWADAGDTNTAPRIEGVTVRAWVGSA